jgi:hypothetical protein
LKFSPLKTSRSPETSEHIPTPLLSWFSLKSSQAQRLKIRYTHRTSLLFCDEAPSLSLLFWPKSLSFPSSSRWRAHSTSGFVILSHLQEESTCIKPFTWETHLVSKQPPEDTNTQQKIETKRQEGETLHLWRGRFGEITARSISSELIETEASV